MRLPLPLPFARRAPPPEPPADEPDDAAAQAFTDIDSAFDSGAFHPDDDDSGD
jgi:hypothetical protein